VKRLPSDSVFVIRITAVNAQGPSKVAYRLRGRTLSAPLLRTGELARGQGIRDADLAICDTFLRDYKKFKLNY